MARSISATGRPIALLVVLLACQAAVVVGATSWVGSRDMPAVAVHLEPAEFSAVPAPDQIHETLGAEVELIGGPALIAPLWNGLVTDVVAQAGDVLRSGTPVVEIDGVRRTVCTGTAPLFRPIVAGMIGADVERASRCLSDAGIWSPSATWSGMADYEFAMAVERFSAGIGADATAELDPAWFIWTPIDGWQISSVAVSIGAPAPAAGTPIAIGAAIIRDVRLEPSDSQRLNALSVLAFMTRSPATVGFEGAEHSAELGVAPIDALRLLDVPSTVLQELVLDDSMPSTVLTVSIEVLVDLSGTAANSVVSVPAAAVLGDDEHACVMIVEPGRRARPAILDYAIDLGQTSFVGGLNAGEMVLIDPISLDPVATCAGEMGWRQ